MISGKAVSRALRGHFLVEAALVKRLAQPIIEEMGLEDQTEIKIILERTLKKEATVEDVNQAHALQPFSSKVENSKDILEAESRTAKLWIRYLRYLLNFSFEQREQETGICI